MLIHRCKICRRLSVSSYISHYVKKHKMNISEMQKERNDIFETILDENSACKTIEGIV